MNNVRNALSNPCQHIRAWIRSSSVPKTIFLVFSRLSHVLRWGLIFDEGRGLTTGGHSSLYWGATLLALILQLCFKHWLTGCKIVVGLRQHSDSRFRVPRDSGTYFTVWWLWEPSEPPPLNTTFLLNNMHKFGSYPTGNTLRLHCKDQGTR
jgi:hypothetical protein